MKRFAIFSFIVALSGMLSSFSVALTIDLTLPCPPESLEQFDAFIRSKAPTEDAFVAVQRVAAPYVRVKQWEKVTDVFKKYRPLFKSMDSRFAKIIALAEALDEGLVVDNLGPGINTTGDEYMPIPSADGSRLYFTRFNGNGCIGGEDIFVSCILDALWQKAVNLGSSINTESHEAALSISADSTRLVFFGNVKTSLGRGDNFYVEKTKSGWGEIQHFPEPINSVYFDADAFLTSDGNAILFVSDRPGGIGEFHEKNEPYHGSSWGNIDIYVCVKTDSGWSAPINLGPTINTPFCEYTPFLHPDGETLYFSSDGHYGLGGLDVFQAERLSDTSWTEWSEPVNWGKEINTEGDDWGYKINTMGDFAYFASEDRADGFGGLDIYSVTVPDDIIPETVATVRGVVTDGTGNPLAADIHWYDLDTQKNVGYQRSDPQDGGYFVPLKLDRNYKIFFKKTGYFSDSLVVDLKDQTESRDIIKDIVLFPRDTVQTNTVYFEFNSYRIKPEHFPELNRLGVFLKENTDQVVTISGHTDSVGTEEYNLWLSEQRVKAVVDYLVSKGCRREQFEAHWYGENKPVASNQNEGGRSENRRCVIQYMWSIEEISVHM